ncbi:MAG TPA: PAS domain-containing protein [Mycobacterium sp.]|nr:PAS domain-containing protein [Mycobacterium sp.]
MARNWLLVETLGDEPAVVAEGRQLKNLIPIMQFLRRSPDLAAIQTAITETVTTGESLASITPKNNRVIRTEPVQMSDGRVHGVQVWIGPAAAEPPERPLPGPLKWDLTLGVATDTPASLANSGRNPETEATHGRAFAEDLPTRDFSPNESKVLALAIRPEAGQTLCSSWDVTDWQGDAVRVAFVARNGWESTVSGRDHLISRGINWRCDLAGPSRPPDVLARQILQAFTQPGVHRALVDLGDWRLLKWLDEPWPLCDRQDSADAPRVHSDDAVVIARMTTEFATGPAAGVLRLRRHDGGWAPMHVTVNRVELESSVAGLVALRVPTVDELAEAALPVGDPPAS